MDRELEGPLQQLRPGSLCWASGRFLSQRRNNSGSKPKHLWGLRACRTGLSWSQHSLPARWVPLALGWQCLGGRTSVCPYIHKPCDHPNRSTLLPCNSELLNNRVTILNTHECLGIISQQMRVVFSKPFIPKCSQILEWVSKLETSQWWNTMLSLTSVENIWRHQERLMIHYQVINPDPKTIYIYTPNYF